MSLLIEKWFDRDLTVEAVADGAMTGICAMTFGAGASTLTGAGALAGSAALTFGEGATSLKGAGALAGAAAMIFGAGASSLQGSGALAGAAAMIFGEGASVLTDAGGPPPPATVGQPLVEIPKIRFPTLKADSIGGP